MTSPTDKELLEAAIPLLWECGNLTKVAQELGVLPSTLHSKFARQGYRVKYRAYLEPIAAPELQPERSAAA